MSARSTSTTVLIIDDHPVVRHGLRHIIESDRDFHIVAEAGDGETALAQVQALRPEILVIDLSLPKIGGLDVVRQVQALNPSTACLVLTMNASENSFNAAMNAGARGYMLKEGALDGILTALRAVASGGVYVCPGVSTFLVRRRQRASALKEEKTGLGALTRTELQVLQLVSENKTNKEIAAQLFISPRTVEAHRSNLCRKLELHGAHKLLEFAIAHRSEF